jgi:hypothetical protein
MSVNVGVKEKWQIRENLTTPCDLTSPTIAPPETPLFLQIANVPGWRPIVAPEGGGCLKNGDDGHLYAHTISQEGVRRAEGQYTLSKKHATVFSSLLPIVRSLPPNADVRARRAHIAAALAQLAAEAEQKGNGEVAVLAQMQVVPLAAFIAHGTIPRRSVKAGAPQAHVPVSSLPERARVLFFSQRWLRRDHPDDEDGTKHAGVAVAARAYAEREGVDEADLYVWFDFASVEQDDFKEMIACINALGLYIAASDAFVAFEHPEYWGRAWCLVEQAFGDAVRVPRYTISLGGEFETLCDGTSLKNKMVEPTAGQLTVESDRPVIEMEAGIALALRSQLYYGLNAQVWTTVILEEEINKSLVEGGDGGDGDITGMHGRDAAAEED